MREKMTDLSFFPSEMFDKKFRYDGGDLGAQCGQEGTSFKVWSPFAEEVTLRLYRDGSSESFLERQLERKDRGVWELEFPENLHGV